MKTTMSQGETVSHTPGPWQLEYNPHYSRHELRGGLKGVDGRHIFGHFQGWSADGVTTEDEDNANAQFIVKAVNCHDALLEACKVALGTIEWLESHGSERAQASKDAITDAITKAEAHTKEGAK